ncbi:MAG: TonB-dependent receptor [Verrucomicrobiota bacterium]
MLPRVLRPSFFAWLALALALSCSVTARAAEGTGTLTGTVSNAATSNLLPGARVEVPQLQFSVLADETGSYALTGLPAGTHEVVVTYIGLDPTRRSVTISTGQRAVQNFDLTTGIYKLAEFKVTGEREGDASAITAQRNAQNVKNVTATDSFGNLPNMNAGEVALRFPGVYGELDAGGNPSGFTIRGMGAGLNSITMDGSLMTGQGGMGRSIFVNNISAAMLDQVELIKGQTPDKSAESMGGTINFKSRSPLSMREKRRVVYTLSARVAPSFTQQIPQREQNRVHALANLSYTEIFDVFCGSRNLGVVVNLFNSEVALGWFTTLRDFQNTTTQPAYVWDYRTGDVYNHRRQKNINTKIDYLLSPGTKLSLNAAYIDHSEVYRRQYDTRAYGQNQNTVPNATTTSVVPGFTDRVTTIRPVATSMIDITMTGPNNFFNRLRRVDLGAEHKQGPWEIDYNARYTQTHINIGNGEGGVLVNRITNVGWILDRTESDLYPKFIQNGGPDFTNPNNYRPAAANALTNGNNTQTHEVKDVTGNFRYTLPTRAPVFAKVGFEWREQLAGVGSASRRWNYRGTGPLPADDSILLMDEVKTGRNLPQWETSHFIRAREVIDPSLWNEDLYFRETTKFTGSNQVTETVTAGYAMLQGKLGHEGWLRRTGFLGGVRVENTRNEILGWVRSQTLTSAADQTRDPVGSALKDYGNNFRETEDDYSKAFPSVHLSHDVTENLKARLSWSTGFGRPRFTALVPNVTPNEANRTVTVNNPSLVPQTAENWDATLEYYFEPVGTLSVGWFHKTIDDYIVNGIEQGTLGTGNDNGYNGEYPGYMLLSAANAGTAVVQGWEFSYQQQFTFLPGVLRGLSCFFNYTVLDTHGKFDSAVPLSSGQVAGFVPRTANAQLSWKYRRFSTRLLANYATDYLDTYNATAPGRNLYRFSRKLINLGFSYQVRPSLNVTLDIDNLTNVPQKRYRGIPDQVEYFNYPGTTFTVGLSGRF